MAIKTLDNRRRALPDKHIDILESAHDLGLLCKERGDYEKAEPLLLEAYNGSQARLGPDHPHTIGSLRTLVHLYESWNKPDEAAQWRAKLPQVGDVEKQN